MPSLPTPGVTTSWGDDLNAAIESLHLTGTHAARPSTGLVTGTLYSCTDHGLVYTWDGDSWETWAGTAIGAFARAPGTQSCAHAAVTMIALTTELHDTHTIHDNVTNNTRLTVPANKGGLWAISGQVTVAPGSTTGAERTPLLYVNGTQIADVAFQPQTFSTLILNDRVLAAGDYVELGFYHDAGVALTVRTTAYPTTWLAMHRIGA